MKDKFGFIDSTGKEILPFIYDDAKSFQKGLALVSKDGKSFFINKKGMNVRKYRNPEENERKREKR